MYSNWKNKRFCGIIYNLEGLTNENLREDRELGRNAQLFMFFSPHKWKYSHYFPRFLKRPKKAGFIILRERETWEKGGLIFPQMINGH